MPAPHLVVVTPPAYRDLLLHPHRPPKASSPDAGIGPSDGGASAEEGPDAGVPGAPAPDWTQLVRRLDAQDSIMPADGVAMLYAANVLGGRKGDASPARALLLGLPVPHVVEVVLGLRPSPYAELTAIFAEPQQAAVWEAAWPRFHSQLRGNPLLVLGGFSGLLDRITLERDDTRVLVKLTATQDETLRILTFVAAQAAAWRMR
jgi:hypothetical protein